MSQASSASSSSLGEFLETDEVHDPLPSVAKGLGEPTHDLSWQNMAILNARRKPHAYKFPWATWLSLLRDENPVAKRVPDDLLTAEDNLCVQLEEGNKRFPGARLYSDSWFYDGPFESLADVKDAEKIVDVIGNIRTELDRSQRASVWLDNEDGEEEMSLSLMREYQLHSSQKQKQIFQGRRVILASFQRLDRRDREETCRGCGGGRLMRCLEILA